MNHLTWLGPLMAVMAAAGVSANQPDYLKIKTDMELESSQLISKQREVMSRINSSAENLVTEGGRALAEFKTQVNKLVPYLSQTTSEPFMDNIQEFINSKTTDRQDIIKTISDTKMYRDRAEKELRESENRYNKMLEHLTSSSELEKNIRLAVTHYKSLGLTNERLNEIKDKLLGFGAPVKEKVEKISTANKKLELYRHILEMAKRTRAIVSESKKAYVDSFTSKDRILDFSNRMDSLVKRAKLLLAEAKKRGVYRVELDKMSALSEELNKLKEKIEGIARSTSKAMENMQATLAKGEGYERSIIEEATLNKFALSKGFTRGKQVFAKMAKVHASTQSDTASIEQYKRETAEVLQKANALVNEMDSINRRRSAVSRKSLNISTPQDLRSLVELDYPADIADSESPELDLGDMGADLSSGTNAKTPREQSNSDAIGSYLRDLEDEIDSSDYRSKIETREGEGSPKKKKGLIKKGFKFLKKLALAPESLVDPSRSATHSYADHHYDQVEQTPASDASTRTKPEPARDRVDQPATASAQNATAASTEQSRPSESTEVRESEEYKRAVKESIESKLEKTARDEFERLKRNLNPDSYKNVDNDIYRLVELAYLLKKQFELVKDDLKRSLTENTLDIFRNALKNMLHQHLSSVCSVALDLTRPKPMHLFSINSGADGSNVGVATRMHSPNSALPSQASYAAPAAPEAGTPAQNEVVSSEHQGASPADSNQQPEATEAAPTAPETAPAAVTNVPSAQTAPAAVTNVTSAQTAPANPTQRSTVRYNINRFGGGAVPRTPSKLSMATKIAAFERAKAITAGYYKQPQQAAAGAGVNAPTAEPQNATTADVGTNTAAPTVAPASVVPTPQFKFTPVAPQQLPHNAPAQQQPQVQTQAPRVRPVVGTSGTRMTTNAPMGSRVLINSNGPTRFANNRVARRPAPYSTGLRSASNGPVRARTATRVINRPVPNLARMPSRAPVPAGMVNNFGTGQPGQFAQNQFAQQVAQPVQPAPMVQPVPQQNQADEHIYANIPFVPTNQPQQSPQVLAAQPAQTARPLPPLPPMPLPRANTAHPAAQETLEQPQLVGPPKPFRNVARPVPAAENVAPVQADQPPTYQEAQQGQQQPQPVQPSPETTAAPKKQKKGTLRKIFRKFKGKKKPKNV